MVHDDHAQRWTATWCREQLSLATYFQEWPRRKPLSWNSKPTGHKMEEEFPPSRFDIRAAGGIRPSNRSTVNDDSTSQDVTQLSLVFYNYPQMAGIWPMQWSTSWWAIVFVTRTSGRWCNLQLVESTSSAGDDAVSASPSNCWKLPMKPYAVTLANVA